MLVNWLASAIVDGNAEFVSDRDTLAHQDTKSVSTKNRQIVGHICAYLLAAGVLRQVNAAQGDAASSGDFRVSVLRRLRSRHLYLLISSYASWIRCMNGQPGPTRICRIVCPRAAR